MTDHPKTTPKINHTISPAIAPAGHGEAAHGGGGHSSALAPRPQRTTALVQAGVRNVCVYCGSGKGTDPQYAAAARVLGQGLAKADIGLVYGGGGLGLMGEVAKATLAAGGRVTGIIPEFLSVREHMLTEVTDLIVTRDMHERKKLMFERSDAFVALPGGIGTLEELVEQLTWAQLGQHQKPIVLANIEGFWTPFIELLEHMRGQAFIRKDLEVRFDVVDDAADIVPRILATAARVLKPAVEVLIEKL